MNRRRFLLALPLLALAACNRKAPPQELVIYTSVDDVFARPIAELFQKQSGITVKLVPDTEETKSTGLLNRLIAEKDRPVADVFWSGDIPVAVVPRAKRPISSALHRLSHRLSERMCASGASVDGDRNVAAPWAAWQLTPPLSPRSIPAAS